MTTTITIESQRSPHHSTHTSSRSNSRSNSFTDEEGSSGTGVHVSPAGSHELSNHSDDSWEGISGTSEIEPSDSASRPPTSNLEYRDPPRRTRAPAARAPPRRHTTTERTNRRPPSTRVHRHPVPAPPSSVDGLEDYPGYGRGYPTPQPGPYGARMPPQGYAQSAYSAGPYAPPFAAPGALTHYGGPGGYQYPPANPFSPQPTPGPGGGAGYFAPHHMSGHSTPGGYPGQDIMQYPPPQPGYGAGFAGYGPHGAMGGHNMQYYPPWPPSEGSIVGIPDPETERKLQAVTELMEKQKLEYDKLQKKIAEEAEKEAKAMQEKIEQGQRELAEKAAKAQQELDERKAKEAAERAALEAARKTAEEKAAWEKRIEMEKKQALADWEEAQRKAIAAAAEQAKKAAEEKAEWERKVEHEKKKALLEFEAAQAKAAHDRAEAARIADEEKKAWEKKLDEERKAAMAKGVENAKKEAEKAKEKAEKEAAEAAAKKAVADELEKVKKEAAEAEKKLKEEAAEAEKKLKEEAAEAEKKLKEEHDKAVAKLTAPPAADKKKPVKFKDAVGRKFSFPFELCATWAGMEELIRQAFLHVEGLGPHVAEGHYDLIGPNGEIILPRVWETTIEPDWSVSMHMWPMPEPAKQGFPGPPPGHHFRDGHGGRPQSRHGHHGHSRGMPGPPPSQMRGGLPGGPPPPPPTNWPGGGPPPGAMGPRGGPGPGGPPVIVNLTRGPPGSRSRSRRADPARGVLGWMTGASAKARPSGKGAKKADPDACLVM